MIPAPFNPATDGWWLAAFASPLGLMCLAVAAGCVLGLALLLRAMVRLGAPGRARLAEMTRAHLAQRDSTRAPRAAASPAAAVLPVAALHLDQRATATLEFALVFPFLLLLAMTLAQTTYLMGDNLFVHYAAFSAARSAIVQIPRDLPPEEPANTVVVDPASNKLFAIRSAAVAALVPASGLLESGDETGALFAAALTHHYAAYGMAPPRWIDATAASRYRYASANTSVSLGCWHQPDDQQGQIVNLAPGETYAFGPHDAVAASVTHRISLSVPYVSLIFADGRHTAATGSGRYATVTASCLLTNEGVVDALPPLPPYPRDP